MEAFLIGYTSDNLTLSSRISQKYTRNTVFQIFYVKTDLKTPIWQTFHYKKKGFFFFGQFFRYPYDLSGERHMKVINALSISNGSFRS